MDDLRCELEAERAAGAEAVADALAARKQADALAALVEEQAAAAAEITALKQVRCLMFSGLPSVVRCSRGTLCSRSAAAQDAKRGAAGLYAHQNPLPRALSACQPYAASAVAPEVTRKTSVLVLCSWWRSCALARRRLRALRLRRRGAPRALQSCSP